MNDRNTPNFGCFHSQEMEILFCFFRERGDVTDNSGQKHVSNVHSVMKITV